MEKVLKPWGYFETFAWNERCTVKVLTVMPHEVLSYQYHRQRKEYWQILAGDPAVRIEDKVYHPDIGEGFTIPAYHKHQLIGRSLIARVLEISTGVFDEEDIIRLEDKYNRLIKG